MYDFLSVCVILVLANVADDADAHCYGYDYRVDGSLQFAVTEPGGDAADGIL